MVRRIVGYDAASLYLWCVGEEMPCGVLTYDRRSLSLTQVLAEVRGKRFFGFVQVDIHVPEHLRDHFSEMPPIFKNTPVPFEVIGDHMQAQFRAPEEMVDDDDPRPRYPNLKESTRLIGSFQGTKKWIYTPLLEWYLAHGLVVTHVHKRIQAVRGQPFAAFRNWVTSERAKADECKDGSLEARGLGAKMVGNAAVGGSMMDKTRHSQTRITADVKKVLQYHNDPRFKSTTVLKLRDPEDLAVSKLFEITRGKRIIRQDRPLQIGVAVYDLAKMRMLEFYYDFLDKFVPREDFQMLEMDTDSVRLRYMCVCVCVRVVHRSRRPHVAAAARRRRRRHVATLGWCIVLVLEVALVVFLRGHPHALPQAAPWVVHEGGGDGISTSCGEVQDGSAPPYAWFFVCVSCACVELSGDHRRVARGPRAPGATEAIRTREEPVAFEHGRRQEGSDPGSIQSGV